MARAEEAARLAPVHHTAPHRHHHQSDLARVECVVITASDTRTPETDVSGRRAAELLEEAGHRVLERRIVRETLDALQEAVGAALQRPAGLVLVTGGTGVGPRDRTPDALAAWIDTPLPGFGETFRRLSVEQVGPVGWTSRALAGLHGEKLLVGLPGSPAAVQLGLRDVLLPVLPHLLGLAAPRGHRSPKETP